MAKLEVKNLAIYYSDFQALDDITVEIKKTSVTAFIGPSGCGKSTFLRSLNRMNELIPNTKTEGKVLLEGQNIYDATVDVVNLRKRIGMVFQRPNPFPMSIYDNVTYGPKLHGVKNKEVLDEIVEKNLKRAAVWEAVKNKLQQSAFDLSGGQQQRLCIARVLAVNPEVVLMDEPCSALDPAATQRIEDLITELKEKYTIVIVTHNMQQAARISDYTAFFLADNTGGKAKLIEYSKTKKLFTAPTDKRTEDYITGRFG
ncbi:hypothetical protein LCGC14_0628940 [marine sediment metagenome]|uniref:ABC transporter domain-containing protein n=1 Tax=marine sediment metagenome TaxID=412755 RepID=A0A0F9RM14_9ZZZZ